MTLRPNQTRRQKPTKLGQSQPAFIRARSLFVIADHIVLSIDLDRKWQLY